MSETALAIPMPIDNVDKESALASAFAGQLVAGDINELCFAEEDEAGDINGIVPNVPRISANAKFGTFHEPSMDELERVKQPGVIEGVILARRQSNTLYPPKDDKADIAKTFGYDQLLGADKGPKWLCRNDDTAKPSEAFLNPQLSDGQLAEAKRLGIGGATGHGCLQCSAGAWRKLDNGRNVRVCTRGENFVWLDSKSAEPVVLQVQASSSVTELGKWLSKTFLKMGRQLSLFSYAVRFGWRNEKINDRKTNILTPEIIVPLGDKKQIELLRKARASLTWMLDRAVAQQSESVMPSDLEEHIDGSHATTPTASESDALDGML